MTDQTAVLYGLCRSKGLSLQGADGTALRIISGLTTLLASRRANTCRARIISMTRIRNQSDSAVMGFLRSVKGSGVSYAFLLVFLTALFGMIPHYMLCNQCYK
uniref:Uncharacterized protein n=1 Tax=Guillardia theta TaxID=55529 RepID=A0A7S4U6P9_GUITH